MRIRRCSGLLMTPRIILEVARSNRSSTQAPSAIDAMHAAAGNAHRVHLHSKDTTLNYTVSTILAKEHRDFPIIWNHVEQTPDLIHMPHTTKMGLESLWANAA